MLRDVCHRFHIEEPFHTLRDTKYDVDGKKYYRCKASLCYRCIGKPKPCIKMFAHTEEKARDNVATMLLRRLLASTSRYFFYYNQYNMLLLEDQFQRLVDHTFKLI